MLSYISVFLFNVIHYLEPTELASKLLSKSYYNERAMGKLKFFDYSISRMGKKCITNYASKLVEEWNFDWFFLSAFSFKSHLRRMKRNNLFFLSL